MSLPLADPQFWIVTGGAALALGYAIRRIRRRARSDNELPCDRCAKPGGPLAPSDGDSRRTRRLGALAAAVLAGTGPSAAESVARETAVMGTVLRVEVEIVRDRAQALATAETMIREMETTEARLSTWRETSELVRINRAPVGEWVETDAQEALAAAADCWRATGGAFHPALGRLVAAWDLRGSGRVPTPAEIAEARNGLDGLGFEPSRSPDRVRRTADVVLEEGGFGKGAGLDGAMDAALGAIPGSRRQGFVRLDLGGQIAWANAERPVVVDLADPRDRSRPVLELALTIHRGSIASSGDSEKRFTLDGESYGHLLDPRTAAPAADFGSVAVVDSSALRADCLSTALFVMGPDAGARWLAGSGAPRGAVFLIAEGDRLRARLTPELALQARPLVAELEIEILNGSS